MASMPNVAIHDLVIHPRDGDLIAGTHGRSLWICDDITPLQQMNNRVSDKDLHVFEPKVATKWQRVNIGRTQPSFEFRGKNPPRGGQIHYYLKKEADVAIEIKDLSGEKSTLLEAKGEIGINRVSWNLSFPPSKEEMEKFRSKQLSVISTLNESVPSQYNRNLSTLEKSLSEAKTVNDLNDVRSSLVAEYNAFVSGKDFFGPKLGNELAEDGEYRVTVKAGKLSMTTKIRVRKDPILQE